MSRYTLYAIVTSFFVFFAWGCLDDEGSESNTNGESELDAGQDIRVHPNADVTSGWDTPDTSTEEEPTISGEVCDNLQDDDSDTLVDCDDPDCTDFADCQEVEVDVEVDCNNSIDDDGDFRADCDDPDCATDPSCTGPTGDEVCDNDIDDDADGLTDCYDGDCAMDEACRPTTAEDCFNSIDDDGDTLVDCDDPDCERACTEGSTGGDEEMMMLCLLMCMLDPDMMACLESCMGGGMGFGETDCTNGIDDDSNGATDCEDPACMMDPACM